MTVGRRITRVQRKDLDPIDHSLLGYLERNGRATLAEIGLSVGLSASAVKRRMARLEDLGVIVGYAAIIDHTRSDSLLEALVELRFSGSTRVDAIASVVEDIDEISDLLTIAGDPDAVAMISVRNMDHLKKVIDRIRANPDVVGTKTLIVLGRARGQRSSPANPRSP